jgi:hypothetical protein
MAGRARQADADVIGRLTEALSEFGLGRDALQERLGGRSWKVLYSGLPHVLKLAADGAVDRLHHEARCLHDIAHREVVIGEHAFLVPYIKGHLLVAETLDEAALRACLAPVHEAGYTFCDLRPSNVIVAAGQCHLIDWEFCTRTGTSIEDMSSRPYSSGFTHPDLLWAKGVVDPRLDHFSKVRLRELLR